MRPGLSPTLARFGSVLLRASGRERPFSSVPRPFRLGLVFALLVQIALHAAIPKPSASADALRPPPALAGHRSVTLGEPVFVGKLTNLWLQAHDNPPGISIPYARVDYLTVRQWLERIIALDPDGQYPLMAASRLYGSLQDPVKQRIMFDFVHAQFAADPVSRWRWLAHAAITTKYQLRDMATALQYAKTLTRYGSRHPDIPFWARDLSVLLLQDMCELEAAKVLIGGLLADGQLSDPHEQQFLRNKLEEVASSVNCTIADLKTRAVQPTS